MRKEEKIKDVLNKNNGYITTDDFLKLNICKPMIKKYIDNGLVRKVYHGLYINNNILEDDYYILQKKYNGIVFSHDTALYMHKLIPENPVDIDITVVKDKKVRGMYKIHHVKKEYYDIGIIEVESPFHNLVKVYDMERCICDLVRSNKDLEFKEKIINRYLLKKDKNIDKLLEYSKIFNIYESISKMLEK